MSAKIFLAAHLSALLCHRTKLWQLLDVSVEFENHTAVLQNLTCLIMGLGGEGREERRTVLN
jgi:hypothetical protein